VPANGGSTGAACAGAVGVGAIGEAVNGAGIGFPDGILPAASICCMTFGFNVARRAEISG
jgi:hypothetical protein